MSLYKVAHTTKKALLVIVSILAVILVVRIVVSIVDSLSKTLITEFSIETRGFGDLPPLALSQIAGAESLQTTFQVETLSGKLPEYSELFNVYRIFQPNRTLASEAFAQNVAEVLEFETQPEKISALEWEWIQFGKNLSFNVQTKHFTYTNTMTSFKETSASLDNPERTFQSILQGLGYEFSSTPEFLVEYVEVLDGEYLPTQNFLSDFVRISLISNLEYSDTQTGLAVSETYFPSPVYVVIQNIEKASYQNIVELRYSLWEPDLENKQTYSGKSVEEAYERLQKGGGALVHASYSRKTEKPDLSIVDDVRITDVSVGYYSPQAYITYLQPIYVFYASHGDQDDRIDLVYYVPAL